MILEWVGRNRIFINEIQGTADVDQCIKLTLLAVSLLKEDDFTLFTHKKNFGCKLIEEKILPRNLLLDLNLFRGKGYLWKVI
jgi:hypothetical protein